MPPQNKTRLRQVLLQRRKKLGYGRQLRAAHQLARNVSQLSEFQSSRHIAAYMASHGELDCRQLIKHCWRQGKRCYLPVIDSNAPDTGIMHFCLYRPGTALQSNRFGLREPSGQPAFNTRALDLVLTPMVGFDRKGHRIGMGGGFYDRNFAFKSETKGLHRKSIPLMIGVAHKCQRLARITPNPWDLAMDRIIAV